MQGAEQMATMTKKELVLKIAAKCNLPPAEVRKVVQSFLDHLIEGLASGERYEFRDFGVFEVVVRKQKIGRNPKNASIPIVIPERSAVKFTPGKRMKEEVEVQPSQEKKSVLTKQKKAQVL